MQISLPNQVFTETRKSSLRELAIINSASLHSEKNHYHISKLNELLNDLSFFETIYQTILKQQKILPTYLSRSIFSSVFLMTILIIIKILIRANELFQLSIDVTLLLLNFIFLIIIIYCRNYLFRINGKYNAMRNYLTELVQIKLSITNELNKEPYESTNPEKFIVKINNDIDILTSKFNFHYLHHNLH